MNSSFDMHRCLSSKNRRRDDMTHPGSAKLFGHSYSTHRGRESHVVASSPSRHSHTPLSMPGTRSSRQTYASLREVPGASFLVSFRYTGRQATEIKDIVLFKNLTDLDLSGNLLKTHVEELHHLKFLKKLNLSNNEITELWPIPKKVETLVLSNNRLTSISNGLAGLQCLKYLDLSHNALGTLKGISSLSHLQTLLLAYNMLSEMQEVEGLENLVECDLRFNKIQQWEDLQPFSRLSKLEAIHIEGNILVKSGSTTGRRAELALPKLKYFNKECLLCVDSRVRRRYEREKDLDTTGIDKYEKDEVSDSSSESEDSIKEENSIDKKEEKKSLHTSQKPLPIPHFKTKLPQEFKLDLSKCRFDSTKESPIQAELMKQSAGASLSGKRPVLAIPRLPIQSIVKTVAEKNELELSEAPAASAESLNLTSERSSEPLRISPVLFQAIQDILKIPVRQEHGPEKIKEIIREFEDQKNMEREDLLSKQSNLSELYTKEKERNGVAKEKIRLLVSEINKLREDLRTQKENALANQSLTSQLLAYQIIHKQDTACKKRLTDELTKVKTELHLVHKAKHENATNGSSNGLKIRPPKLIEEENIELKKKNQELEIEYKQLKEEMDETVQQLITKIKDLEMENDRVGLDNSHTCSVIKRSGLMGSIRADSKKSSIGVNATTLNISKIDWKEKTSNLEVRVQGKVASYIRNLKMKSTDLYQKLQYSLQQRKKLKDKLSLCTSFIQTLNQSDRMRSFSRVNPRVPNPLK